MKTDKITIRIGQDCYCEDSCDCQPELTLFINGARGFGSATWVADARGKMFYHCNFMGFEFSATDAYDAKEGLKRRLGPLEAVDVRVL